MMSLGITAIGIVLGLSGVVFVGHWRGVEFGKAAAIGSDGLAGVIVGHNEKDVWPVARFGCSGNSGK